MGGPSRALPNLDAVMDDAPIPAGRLSDFVAEFRRAMERGETAAVPCGTCTACCRSGHFVHIGPDEADALAHVPADLLAPAPGYPDGFRIIVLDDRGRCPMLVERGCGIWEHRPRVCRTYDCRVFAATGLMPDQPVIVERARRWRFAGDDDPQGGATERSVRAAAGYLAEHFPDSPPSARAAAAVALADLFDGGVPDGLTPAALAGEIRRRFGQPA